MRAVVIKPAGLVGAALPGLRVELRDIAAEARGLIAAAHAESQRIVAETRQRASAELMAAQAARATAVQDGRREGVELGRAEGLEIGRGQGLAEARERFEAQSEALTEAAKRVVGELSARREQLFENAARDVLVVALAVAQRLATSAGRIDPAVAQESARKALEAVRGASRATLRVNPDDLDRMKDYYPTLSSTLSGRELSIEGDAAVEVGGAIVETASGSADARLETQFALIADELMENWRAQLKSGSSRGEASRDGDGAR